MLGLIATSTLQSGQNLTAAETLGTVMQDATPKPATGPLDTSSPIWAILKMLSALVLVIAALYGGLYLLKKMMTNRRFAASQDAALEVLESAYVGPKKMLSLVRVGKKAVLVGVTDQQISLLTELDADETAVLLTPKPQGKPSESFGHLFKRTTDKLRDMQAKKEPAVVEV